MPKDEFGKNKKWSRHKEKDFDVGTENELLSQLESRHGKSSFFKIQM